MTLEIALVLTAVVVIAGVLAMERLPIDLAALILLAVLIMSGLLNPDKILAGFAGDVIVLLACIFVISGTLARSGITQRMAALLLAIARRRENLAPVLMCAAAALSAFFSNTSATAMLLPTTLRAAKEAEYKPRRLLIPLAYASILGGTCTLIGTSTNLASAGLISRLGLEPYSLFEFVVPGLILTVIGILYISLIGIRLIPKREGDDLDPAYEVNVYLSELLIDDDSAAIGKTLSSLKLEDIGLAALIIVRDGERLKAHGNRKLEIGDKIVVRGSRDALLQARDRREFSIEAESTLTESARGVEQIDIREIILMPGSRMIGKSLKALAFYHLYDVAVLAVYRRGQKYAAQIENMPLQTADVLLVQGSGPQLEHLAANPDVWLLETKEGMPLSTKKGVYALLVMLGAVVLGTTGWLPLTMAFLLGVLVLAVTGCTTMEDAYASIEWRLLVLIACMSSLGVVMQDTGTAAYLADIISGFASTFGVHATLAALGVLTILLTQPMSNAAAALVALPVAVATAESLSADPRPFAIMVTLSASLSFITPLEPASLLVLGIGKYRFRDFVLVGLPLTLIVLAILILLVPLLWPI